MKALACVRECILSCYGYDGGAEGLVRQVSRRGRE